MKLPWPKYKRGVDSNKGKGGLQEFEVLDNKGRDELKTLLNERDEHLDEAFKLDMKIIAVEESTKTLIPAMVPVHNYLRMRFKWYYNWHTKPYARKVHWGILSFTTAILFLGAFTSIYVPTPSQKYASAANTCTTIASGSWETGANWNCGGVPPGSGDTAIIANTFVIEVSTSTSVGYVNINSGGELDIAYGKTLTIDGTGTPFVVNGTFAPTSSSHITYTGANPVTIAATTYAYLNVNNANTTFTLGGNTVYSSYLVVWAGTFDCSTSNLTSGGSSFGIVNNGTFKAGSGIINFSTTTAVFDNDGIFDPGTSSVLFKNRFNVAPFTGISTFYDLTIYPNLSANQTFTLDPTFVSAHSIEIKPIRTSAPLYTTTITLGNNLSVSAGIVIWHQGSYAAITLNTSASNYSLSVTGDLYLSNATLIANASAINVNGDFRNTNTSTFTANTSMISVTGNWDNSSSTFTAGTSTVTFNGTSAGKTIKTGGTGAGYNFYNVTFNGSGGAWSPMTNTMAIANNLTMTAGTFDTSNGTANVTVLGNVTGAGTIDMTLNGSTNTFYQSSSFSSRTFGTTSGTNQWKFYNLTIGAGPGNLTTNTGGSGDITVKNTLKSSGVAVYMGNRVWHFTGGTPIDDTMGNIFRGETSTFSFEKTSGTITLPRELYNNITFNVASGAPTFNLDFASLIIEPCLLPDTKITTPNGIKNIENLVKDDQVLSYDYTLKKIVSDKVTSTLKTTSDNYYLINNKVKATWNHRFYLANGELKMVQDLSIGDILKTQDGTELITTIEKINQPSDVYDISVEKNQNFFADGYLVHNANTNGTLTIGGNLLMTGAGAATLSASATKAFNTVVTGNVTIGTGHTYAIATGSDSNPASLSVGGNWSNSGTFTPSTGTVSFKGTSTSVISGNTTFYDLVLDTTTDGAKIVNFASGSTQTINNSLDLNGASGKVLTLGRSGGSGSDQYTFNIPANMTSGDYITVSNNNVDHEITPGDNVTNGGNNTNWMFPVVNTSTPTPTSTTTTTTTSSVLSVTSPKIGLVTLPSTPIEIEISTPEPDTGDIPDIGGEVLIQNVFGKTIENIQINESEKEALVTINNKNVVLWNNPWWRVGLFKAEVKVVKDGKDLNNTVNFIVIPLWIWIFLALTLAFEIYRVIAIIMSKKYPSNNYNEFSREDNTNV